MLLLMITLAGLPTSTPNHAICPAEFDASALKLERPYRLSPFTPHATDMPDTTVQLVCRVDWEGGLTACAVKSENPVGWGFGAWARAEAGRWRVLTKHVLGCPVAGHTVALKIRSGLR